jgi:dUTP pyrophosphatase
MDKMNMQRVRVSFAWLDSEKNKDLSLPAYQSELASGMDVAAAVDSAISIHPSEIKMIPTGFALAIPPGYEIQIRPRSGLAVKHGVTVINSPGTIDADYRGEVKIALVNHGQEIFKIKRGDRIAQMILAPVCQAEIILSESLDPTKRQGGGFGHTGV